MTRPLRATPLSVYETALRGADGEPQVRYADGTRRPLGAHRWLAEADEADLRAIAGLPGPVLDVGCGPGRLLPALKRDGVRALGIDISPIAVQIARRAGGVAIVASVFDELPLTGRWGSALLLDGNVGIGGDAQRLLERVRTLLAPSGRLLVELEAPERVNASTKVRLEHRRATSAWFRWTQVSTTDLPELADRCGYTVDRAWSDGDRRFATLRR